MQGGTVASLLLAFLISQVTSQCHTYTAEERAPHRVVATINETVCESGISDTPVKAFVSWDPPRAVISPIKAYVIHVITAQGVDIQIRVPPNVTQHVVDSLACWEAYTLRVEAQFESGESAFSNAVLYSTGNQGHDFLPKDLSVAVDRTTCENGGRNAFINLRWKPARLGNFNVSGYTVTIYADNGKTNYMHFDNDTRVVKYVPVNCNGTTVIGVSAKTLVNLGLFDYAMGEVIFPATYVAISTDTEPYVVPAKGMTTTPSSVTKGKSTITERPSSTTTQQSTTKVTTTTEHGSTTTVASTEHRETTNEPHYSTTISNDVLHPARMRSFPFRDRTCKQDDVIATVSNSNNAITFSNNTQKVEPVSSGVSTSTILCAVLIPLAIIVLAGLLFFGYKKYKQAGGEGLLSNSDSP